MFYTNYREVLDRAATQVTFPAVSDETYHLSSMKLRKYRTSSFTEFSLHKLIYTTTFSESFFFNFTELRRVVSEYNHKDFTVSGGLGGVAKKAERRDVKNLLSWWNYVFSGCLAQIYCNILRRDAHMLILFFRRFNNLSLRYLFMNELYVRNLASVPALYFFKYPFYIKTFFNKKKRHLKKYKKKTWLHADRFDRREFWART